MNRASKVVAVLCAALTVTLAMALAGCSAAPQTVSTPTPTMPASSVNLPSGGVLISDAGFAHGPAGFSLPRGLQVLNKVDQNNVVTIVSPPAQAQLLHDYLRRSLPALGWTITADNDSAMLAHGQGWDAALSLGPDAVGLTLRKQGVG